ncbi:hypothetical protein [Amycolatopsis tolypomycina]|uniref:hypothetical protein n=1 Tax=Amycolatopsis tolypomycina TaxID=208445 RepID=UPI0033B287B8
MSVNLKRAVKNLVAGAGVAAVLTLSLGGVASAKEAGDYYGPFATEGECESARVLFNYADPCYWSLQGGGTWWFYGGF